MAWLGLGVFYTGVIVGIPVVTGVSEGVHHQKKVNEEAAQETRMVKFYLDTFCEEISPSSKEVNGSMVVLKHGKVRTSSLQYSLPYRILFVLDHGDIALTCLSRSGSGLRQTIQKALSQHLVKTRSHLRTHSQASTSCIRTTTGIRLGED
jgi:hypothetical protein